MERGPRWISRRPRSGQVLRQDLPRIDERSYARPLPDLSRTHHLRLTEPIDARTVGLYRELPARDLERIEDGCAEGMEALGYPFTAPRAPRPTRRPRAMARIDRLQDEIRFYTGRLTRLRYGLARRGIGLRRRGRSLIRRLAFTRFVAATRRYRRES